MRKKIIQYSPKLKMIARELRKSSTVSERRLWRYLRRKQIQGYRFHRQFLISVYIVDFYCPDLKLVIEIDGICHAGKQEYDLYQEKKLEKLGLKVLGFTDEEVKNGIEGVLCRIEEWIMEYTPLAPQKGGSL